MCPLVVNSVTLRDEGEVTCSRGVLQRFDGYTEFHRRNGRRISRAKLRHRRIAAANRGIAVKLTPADEHAGNQIFRRAFSASQTRMLSILHPQSIFWFP